MRILLPPAAALVLMSVVAPAARAGLLDQYRAWQSWQSTQTASKALKEKNYDQAVVAARRALQLNPSNAEAVDVMAQLSSIIAPEEAVKWRQRLTKLTPDSPDAWLGLAEAAVDARQYDVANAALGKVPEPSRTLRFYRDAGSLALAVNNKGQAIEFFRQAIAQPGAANADHFNVAALELFSGSPERVPAAKAELVRLSADPTLAVKCHRLLASFALTTRNFAEAGPQIDYLLGLPEVQFEDVLLALDLFLQTDRPKFNALLHNCFVRFKDEPLPASQVVRWLNAKDLLAEALAGVSQVSPRTAADPTFKAALADTYVRQKNWDGLEDWCKDPTWGVNDYLRIAYLLKAQREKGEVTISESLNAWRESLAKAEQHADRIAALFHLAMAWGWRQEAEGALWAAADASADRREALGALWRWYEQEKNTGGLFRVANRLLELDFSDRVAKNNVVMLGSLLGIKNRTFRDWARDNWDNDPGKRPQFGTTYAFMLYQEGDFDDASRVLNQIDGDLLQSPDDALYAGIIKAGLGDRDNAKRLLEVASRGNLLPEEKKLLTQSRSSLN